MNKKRDLFNLILSMFLILIATLSVWFSGFFIGHKITEHVSSIPNVVLAEKKANDTTDNQNTLTFYNSDVALFTYSYTNTNIEYYNVNADFVTNIYTDYNGTQLNSIYINCSLYTLDINNSINGSFLSYNLIYDNWVDDQFLFENILSLTLNVDIDYESDYNMILFTFTLEFEYVLNDLSETFERSITFDYYTTEDIESVIYSTSNIFNIIGLDSLASGSYQNGYDIGYDIGEELGYQNGYDARDIEYESTNGAFEHVWQFISNAFASVFNVFDIELFTGIKLFHILAIPLIISILYFVIKILAK